MSDRHKTPTISLRLPAGLDELAERAAAAEGKSRHAWIVGLVEAACRGLGGELGELGDQGAAAAGEGPAFAWFGE